jgi:hypothetical protein
MAPASRMMRAQRSRIAANMSNMAAPIFKNICQAHARNDANDPSLPFATRIICDANNS